jgi:nucleoside-triphosphatase
MVKNIFITGKPSCGKTTLIIEILEELKLKVGGFYTKEIREKGVRKGFKIISLDRKEGILAHVSIKSPYKVSKYGVNVKDLEEIGVKSILNAQKENKIIVIDEIGKMELFSEEFKKAVLKALESKNKVLGTIKMTKDSFTDKIKKRKDVKIFYLQKENREKVKEEIKRLLKNE